MMAKVEFKDLSKHTYELYDELLVNSYQLYNAVKEEYEACWIDFATDAPVGSSPWDYTNVECSFLLKKYENEIKEAIVEADETRRKKELEKGEPPTHEPIVEALKRVAKKIAEAEDMDITIYDVSEYDEAYLLVVK